MLYSTATEKLLYSELAVMVEKALSANGAEIPEAIGETFKDRAVSAAEELKKLGVEVDLDSALTKKDCYKVFTDAYNEVTELKALQAENEQSLDEIEKTETVVLDK